MRNCFVFASKGAGRHIVLGRAWREREIVPEPRQPPPTRAKLFLGLGQKTADLDNVRHLALEGGRDFGGDRLEGTVVHTISLRSHAHSKSLIAS
jgi:hypothetical protein